MAQPIIANGFNFENVKRNAFLAQKVPSLKNSVKMMKTGTGSQSSKGANGDKISFILPLTIGLTLCLLPRIFLSDCLFFMTLAGCIFDGGVVMGSDNRATAGDIIADKSCMKVHYMASNIYCCGSGTSADCDQVTKMVSTNLALHAMETGREQVRLTTACRMLSQHLFNHQGHVSAGLILGGVDINGPAVYRNGLKMDKGISNFDKKNEVFTKTCVFYSFCMRSTLTVPPLDSHTPPKEVDVSRRCQSSKMVGDQA